MCTDCYEGWRFQVWQRTPCMQAAVDSKYRALPPKTSGQDSEEIVVTENIKSKLRGNRRDYGLAEHLISRIEPGFDFYIAGGESLFFYVILEKNADIFDKLLSS